MSAITYGLGGSNLIVTYGLGLSSSSPPTGGRRFLMRAYKTTLPSEFIYWEVETEPDAAGDYAPVPAIELSDIVVVAEYAPSGGGGGGSSSLQQAYDLGAIILLSGSKDLEVLKPASGSAAISLQANANSKFEVVGGSLSIYTSTSGNLNLFSAVGASTNIGSTSAVGTVNIATAGEKAVVVGSKTATVTFGAAVTGAQNAAPVGYSLKCAGTGLFSKGHVVHVAASGGSTELRKSFASGAGVQLEVIGVALADDVDTTVPVAMMMGTVVEVLFDGAPAITDPGKTVYLSPTVAGTATLTPPTATGKRVYRLGTLLDWDAGPNGGYYIALNLQNVADL